MSFWINTQTSTSFRPSASIENQLKEGKLFGILENLSCSYVYTESTLLLLRFFLYYFGYFGDAMGNIVPTMKLL